MKSSQRVPLTTRIKFKDKEGRVVGEREVATYAGLLCKAHEEGLRFIRTRLVHVPTRDSPLAIVLATVRTNRGRFTALADATPSNVNAKVAAHYIRVAETRAKSRALRDALDVGTLSLEELGQDEDFIEDRMPPPAAPARQNGGGRPTTENGDGSGRRTEGQGPSQPMSEAQARLLFRIASEGGAAPDQGKAWLEAQLGIAELYKLSRNEASAAIDRLRGGAQNGTRQNRDRSEVNGSH